MVTYEDSIKLNEKDYEKVKAILNENCGEEIFSKRHFLFSSTHFLFEIRKNKTKNEKIKAIGTLFLNGKKDEVIIKDDIFGEWKFEREGRIERYIVNIQ